LHLYTFQLNCTAWPRPLYLPPVLPQYCHANLRIAHRDIKLGNVLLNTKYQIPILKLCDFG